MVIGPYKEYLLEDFDGEDYLLYPLVRRYVNNGSLELILCGEDDEWFCDITIELNSTFRGKQESNRAFVDTHRNPWMPSFLAKHNLGKPTGRFAISGGYKYPEYEFDMSKMNYDEYSS